MVAGDRNDITIKLAPDSRARIVQQSAMKIYPSREKRGEIFDYESFRSNFKIFVDGELIAFDSLRFSPRELELGSIGVLEGAMYIGSVWVVSPKIDDVDLRALQETLRVEEGLQKAA